MTDIYPESAQFTHYELERYQRHLQLPDFGLQGQDRCRKAHIVIIGMGGLGCPVALYLAAAGIGQLTLVDADRVSLSNLQRQILFTEQDVGIHKVQAAANHLAKHNHLVKIEPIAQRLSLTNVERIFQGADLVIDCSDNFHTRYLINDTCYQLGKPWVYSSVLGQQGQASLLQPQYSCLRCLFPKLNNAPDCNQAGVLGVMPGMMGTMQASLALQYLCGVRLPQHNQLIQVFSWPFNISTVQLSQSPSCILCQGHGNKEELSADYQSDLTPLDKSFELSRESLACLRQASNTVLVDIRDEEDFQVNNLGGINIPLRNLSAQFTPKPNYTYVFYCQTGKRSEWALSELLSNKRMELSDCTVYSLKGGMENAL